MKIGFVGMTHLGLCQLAACAEKKFDVLGIDSSLEKIKNLNNLDILYDEPFLKKTIKKNLKRIKFSSNFNEIKKLDLVFISLDLKTNKQGYADTKILLQLINKTKKYLNLDASLIILSQVRPKFTRAINFDKKRLYYQVETLVFGQAISRALNPERIIIGTGSEKFNSKYKNFLKKFNCPLIKMNYESAELSKLSINIFLASSVTVTNLLARIARNIGADWDQIIPALKLDKRIGQYAYLKSGLGLSGGNIERDLFSIKSIIENDDKNGRNLINSIVDNSKYMKKWAEKILEKKLKKNQIIGILGLAYKDKTNSIKNSPSIELIKKIKKNKILAYDPSVNIKKINQNYNQVNNFKEVMKNSDILILMTNWENVKQIQKYTQNINLRRKIILDPHGLLKLSIKKNFKEYFTLGTKIDI
jgi:UDPglucose 6-dehydrogenase|tara:strand:+ start:168 stop:1418 length:1251 start_codon:yes stop_codon:yes gene_type:complete